MTLQITAESPEPEADPTEVGFWSLAALFRPLDTSFMSLLNQEILILPPSSESLEYLETRINDALDHSLDLHDTQKANLRITQLWLQNHPLEGPSASGLSLRAC